MSSLFLERYVNGISAGIPNYQHLQRFFGVLIENEIITNQFRVNTLNGGFSTKLRVSGKESERLMKQVVEFFRIGGALIVPSQNFKISSLSWLARTNQIIFRAIQLFSCVPQRQLKKHPMKFVPMRAQLQFAVAPKALAFPFVIHLSSSNKFPQANLCLLTW